MVKSWRTPEAPQPRLPFVDPSQDPIIYTHSKQITMLSTTPKRVICPRCSLHQQIRHASLIRRPKRPYTFTQLITLSDGSTFTHRTTSPQPIYRSTKDTKNTILWNPSSQKLLNVEEDEAGRLRRFRARFGRGFDVESIDEAEKVGRLHKPFRAHDGY